MSIEQSIEPAAKRRRAEYPKFFKITNFYERDCGFQYQTGLNVSTMQSQEFDSCKFDGICIMTAEYINKFFDINVTGYWLREAFLPITDPDFRIVKQPDHPIWKVNKIILGERYSLMDLATYDRFGLEPNYNKILCKACQTNNMEIAKLMIYKGANDWNGALQCAYENGHYDIMDLILIERLGACMDDAAIGRCYMYPDADWWP